MAPQNTLTVDTEELYAHARAVAQMQQPLDRVTRAVQQVTPDYFDLAYGTVGQNFVLAMRPARELAEDASTAISTTVDGTANQLVQTVSQYSRNDQQNARNLRAIGADLPEDAHNGLIADGTEFDPWQYNIYGKAGYVQEGNGWTEGAGGIDSVHKLYQEITSKGRSDQASLTDHIATAGLDGAGLAGDPLGTLTSWGAGWAMEHLTPLKLLLDMVTGNEQMVSAAAETWQLIGKEQTRLGQHYAAAVRAGTGGWTGEAGTNYRDQAARNTVNALLGAGQLSHAMSALVAVTGEMVKAVRYAYREAIAQAAAFIVTKLAARIGYMPPNGTLAKIATIITICKNLLTHLTTILDGLSATAPRVMAEYQQLKAMLPKLGGA